MQDPKMIWFGDANVAITDLNRFYWSSMIRDGAGARGALRLIPFSPSELTHFTENHTRATQSKNAVTSIYDFYQRSILKTDCSVSRSLPSWWDSPEFRWCGKGLEQAVRDSNQG